MMINEGDLIKIYCNVCDEVAFCTTKGGIIGGKVVCLNCCNPDRVRK